MTKTIYICGPMTSYPKYNFPAFDAAAVKLRARGWDVISPAELNRAMGVDGDTEILPDNFLRNAMCNDLAAVCRSHAIARLPGWEASRGAAVELALANYLGLEVIDVT